MLTKKQLSEIRAHLEKAQNPVFLFDNDLDGLCSYALLRKFLGRGKGVAIKSHPDIDARYAKRVQELGGDYVFVLDRHSLGKDFVQEIASLQLPIVWIDHHDAVLENYEYSNLYYYNPIKNKRKSNEPTTYLCYSAVQRTEYLWLALVGCIADHYAPNFADEFGERYPEFWAKNIKEPFQALYTTGIGRLSMALSFGLKDSISHVVELQNFLIGCSGPADLERELDSNSAFALKYKEVLKKYSSLLDAAKLSVADTHLIFNYSGNLSISSDLSNELSYLFPKKYICVAYSSGPLTNISLRGKEVKKILESLLPNFPGATGGGHKNAVGARVSTSEWEKFAEMLREKLTE